MTYDQPNEMLRFVWRNESFRFRGFGRVRVRNETDDRPMGMELAVWDSSCTKAFELGATPGLVLRTMRSIASRRAVGSDQNLRCGSRAFPSTSSGPSLRGRSAALQNEV